MKLVMMLCVRDEKDIIAQNIRFHLHHGVDHVLVLDNGSVDGTRDILSDLKQSHPITILDEPGRNHDQGKWMTRLARLAIDGHSADWILPNDADEFWWPGALSLKEQIQRASAGNGTTTLNCQRKNMIEGYDASSMKPWQHRLVYRKRKPEKVDQIAVDNRLTRNVPHFYCALSNKLLLPASGLRSIKQGNHDAEYNHDVAQAECGIEIFHFPIRSQEQFVFKTLNGGEGYAQNAELSEATGWHKRRWYWLYHNCGLEVAMQDALPSQQRLADDLLTDIVVKDETLVQELDRHA